MDRTMIPVPSAAPNTATGERAMTAAEQERLRAVELWQASHETLCEGRHRETGLRFDSAKKEMLTAFDVLRLQIAGQIDRSNGLRLVGMVMLGVVVVLVGIKQPAALFELLTKMP